MTELVGLERNKSNENGLLRGPAACSADIGGTGGTGTGIRTGRRAKARVIFGAAGSSMEVVEDPQDLQQYSGLMFLQVW